MRRTHGMHRTPEYTAWANMKHRVKGMRDAERRAARDRLEALRDAVQNS